MGDKGGKKNKEKSQKQKTTKQEHHKKDQQMTRTVEVKNGLFGSQVS